MKISRKLPWLVLGISLAVSLLFGLSIYGTAARALLKAETDALTALRISRHAALTDYLRNVEQTLAVLAASSAVQDALRELDQAWAGIAGDKSARTALLQALYDSSRPDGVPLDTAAAGERGQDRYRQAHRRFHRWFQQVHQQFGYQDLFLFNVAGDLLYTVTKQADFATNFLHGPLRDSGLGRVVRGALQPAPALREQFSDFRRYGPSQNAPASFISAPVRQGDEILGVLAIRLSGERLNRTLQVTAGMGSSGETYLVGADFLMRSDSRFSPESTLLTQQVPTRAVTEGLRGNSGVAAVADYRGVDVLSSFQPVTFRGAHWVLLAEKDLAEIRAPIQALKQEMTFMGAAIALLVAVVGLLMSRALTRPLTVLSAAFVRFGKTHQATELTLARRGDEIGQMAAGFNALTREVSEHLAAVKAERERSDALRAQLQTLADKLVEIGIALSAERDHRQLLGRILAEAQRATNADGGTLYLIDEAQPELLRFAIMGNRSLGIALDGSGGEAVGFPPLPLRDPATGAPNQANVATCAALTGELVNIADAYRAEGFDFSGTRAFDARNKYRSRSILAVPLRLRQGKVIGVLQLINAVDASTGAVVGFAPELEPLVSALASQATIALENQRLLEAEKKLLEAFIQVIAVAIDAKSPYTSGHCQRVPVLTKMLAEAAAATRDGPLADFAMNDEDRYELHIAAWMHDCGKVTTPEYVVDKAAKLETIFDRVELVRTRFEILKRDAEIESLRASAAPGADAPALRRACAALRARIDRDREFVETCNVGGEFMADEAIARLGLIAAGCWTDWNGTPRPALSDEELRNLSIRRGTLTAEERTAINDHIVQTINMLERLPFPKHLRRVPEFAGGHHETMDGKGYPRGLTREQMSVQARAMAIADIFEALTARDRPYKKPKPLSEAVRIMAFMKQDHHIDPDLFDLFLRSGVYRAYAERFLLPEQLDDPDLESALGTRPGG